MSDSRLENRQKRARREGKGLRRGRKISEAKMRLCVDTMGLLHGIRVTPANVCHRKGVLERPGKHVPKLSETLKPPCDKG